MHRIDCEMERQEFRRNGWVLWHFFYPPFSFLFFFLHFFNSILPRHLQYQLFYPKYTDAFWQTIATNFNSELGFGKFKLFKVCMCSSIFLHSDSVYKLKTFSLIVFLCGTRLYALGLAMISKAVECLPHMIAL